MYFDPMYFVFILPAILLAGWASIKVKSNFAHASKIASANNMTGAQAARAILDASGLSNVAIEQVSGQLSDHYDPSKKVLRLSPEVYGVNSLAAMGVAAHEAGHALQDKEKYGYLVVRNALVPVANFGSGASWILMIGGFLLSSFNLVLIGIVAYSTIVLFQLVNLPVEFDASNRAKKILVSRGLISSSEEKEVSKVLGAAALTYVAATLTSVLTLIYYLYRFGLLGGNRDE